MRWVFLFLLNRQGNWGSKGLSYLPKITQLMAELNPKLNLSAWEPCSFHAHGPLDLNQTLPRSSIFFNLSSGIHSALRQSLQVLFTRKHTVVCSLVCFLTLFWFFKFCLSCFSLDLLQPMCRGGQCGLQLAKSWWASHGGKYFYLSQMYLVVSWKHTALDSRFNCDLCSRSQRQWISFPTLLLMVSSKEPTAPGQNFGSLNNAI